MDEKNMKKMVRYQNNVWFTITISPDDDHQYRFKPDRFHCLKQRFVEQFDLWFIGVENIVLYPDLSYPEALSHTQFPRIHYHGIIKFKDVLQFLLSSRLFNISRVEIDTIADMETWIKYCEKFMRYTDTSEHILDMQFFKPKQEVGPDPDGKVNIVEFLKHFPKA